MHQGSGTRVDRRGGIPELAYADLVRQYTRVRQCVGLPAILSA